MVETLKIKGNQQAVRIIVENKNLQALMTKQLIQSFSNSLLSLRNNIFGTQQQFIFVCIMNYYESIFDLFEHYIITVIQQYRSDIGSDNVLSKKNIYRLCNYAFHVRICQEQK